MSYAIDKKKQREASKPIPRGLWSRIFGRGRARKAGPVGLDLTAEREQEATQEAVSEQEAPVPSADSDQTAAADQAVKSWLPEDEVPAPFAQPVALEDDIFVSASDIIPDEPAELGATDTLGASTESNESAQLDEVAESDVANESDETAQLDGPAESVEESTVDAVELGMVRGKPLAEQAAVVKQLKREKQYEDALELLLECISANELLVREGDKQPLAWPTELAAIEYRRAKNLPAEIAVLERFIEAFPDPVGAGVQTIRERLEKAQVLVQTSGNKS